MSGTRNPSRGIRGIQRGAQRTIVGKITPPTNEVKPKSNETKSEPTPPTVSMSSPRSENMPLIWLLDMDNTVLGDVTPELYAASGEYGSDAQRVWAKRLNPEGFIRPYLQEFMQTAQKKYPGSLFFIYTASTMSWAEEVISVIEEKTKIKFARPILHRENTIPRYDNEKTSGNKKGNILWYMKSLKIAIRNIGSSIRNDKEKVFSNPQRSGVGIRYLKTLSDEDWKYIMEKRTILIDNMPGSLKESKRQIVSPYYNFVTDVSVRAEKVRPEKRQKFIALEELRQIKEKNSPFWKEMAGFVKHDIFPRDDPEKNYYPGIPDETIKMVNTILKIQNKFE